MPLRAHEAQSESLFRVAVSGCYGSNQPLVFLCRIEAAKLISLLVSPIMASHVTDLSVQFSHTQ